MEKEKKSIFILRTYFIQLRDQMTKVDSFYSKFFEKIIQRFNIVLQVVPPYITVFVFKTLFNIFPKINDEIKLKETEIILKDITQKEKDEDKSSKYSKKRIIYLILGMILDVEDESFLKNIENIKEDEEYLLFFNYWISLC